MSLPRSHLAYGTAALAIVTLGLASREYRSLLPPRIADYAGDTLWAVMVFLLAAVVWPRAPTHRLAVGALLFCLAIEISQLYQAPWINSLRATRPGALVLGHGFLWTDLLCYAAGIALAAAADTPARRRPNTSAHGDRR